jgi:hypothetical protein
MDKVTAFGYKGKAKNDTIVFSSGVLCVWIHCGQLLWIQDFQITHKITLRITSAWNLKVLCFVVDYFFLFGTILAFPLTLYILLGT